MKKLLKISIPVLVLALLTAATTKDKYFEIVKNLDIFATLYKEVNAYYVDELNPTEVMNTGIEAMLASLDPYTNYIPEDDIEDYRKASTGEYAGIGAVVKRIDGISTIMLPYEGFSAARAGLRIGDQIIKVDGVDITELQKEETDQLLKGQIQSEVVLTIRRPGKKEPFDVTMRREKIKVKNVPYYGMINEEVGYMRLTDFSRRAAKEVKGALVNLKEQGAAKIILDLRGNPGGLLNEAVNICNVFIPKDQEVVTTRGKLEKWTQVYNTLDVPTDTEIPLAVLIDNSSASASEIVSGVMQDYDRGVLIGRKSFGKGLVQQTRPLAYNAQLKVTTAKYYIPSGRCIQALDYSNRNPDGSVGKVPDSLKSAFQTQNGRTVYDGGGVDPDVEVAPREYAAITNSLMNNNLIFHFATQYHVENDTLVAPNDFRVSESLYAAFEQWLKSKEFDYKTDLEKQLAELKKVASEDPNQALLQSAIEKLEQKIDQAKRQDLKTYKEEIKMLMEQEIASRYYLERGIIESTFDKDKDILTALEVLNDDKRYQSILGR